jgi:beta-galactosidase
MEQQAGPSGWEIVSPTPRPGQLRLWAYQAIGHGADGIVFFRWRTARYGTEQYWHGLLDHHGQPGRRYDEIKRMGAELQKIGKSICDSACKARVAILQSYDSRFAFQVQPNNRQFRYAEQIAKLYQTLFDRNIPVDVLAPEADLSDYRMVIVPALHVLTEATASKLVDYVEKGGTVVVTPRTGVKDGANAVVDRPLPGLLAEVCGAVVSEYDSLMDGISQSVKFVIPGLEKLDPVKAKIWCDILAPRGAEVLANYTQEFYTGQPAITLNRYGKGRAVYIGTFGDDELYQALLNWLMNDLGISGTATAPAGVEVTERWQGNRKIMFILNHTTAPQVVLVPDDLVSLLGEEPRGGKVSVAPHDVIILAAQE